MAVRKKTKAVVKKATRKPVKAKAVKVKKAAPAKKTVAKKVKKVAKVAKKTKTAAHAEMALVTGKISVGNTPYSKSELFTSIAERSGLNRKDVKAVMGTISDIIHAHLAKQGPEEFKWPGLFKITVVKKPATKSRKGISPFTGEEMIFKAKPASRKVKVRALKKLKEMAA